MAELSETGVALICSLFLLVAVMVTVAVFVAKSSCKSGGAAVRAPGAANPVRAVEPAVRRVAAAVKRAGGFIPSDDADLDGRYRAGESIAHDATGGMRKHVDVELPPELKALLEANAEGVVAKPLGGNGTFYNDGFSGVRNAMDAVTCTYPSICEKVCNGEPIPAEFRQSLQQFEALCPCEMVQNCMNEGTGVPLVPYK